MNRITADPYDIYADDYYLAVDNWSIYNDRISGEITAKDVCIFGAMMYRLGRDTEGSENDASNREREN